MGLVDYQSGRIRWEPTDQRHDFLEYVPEILHSWDGTTALVRSSVSIARLYKPIMLSCFLRPGTGDLSPHFGPVWFV